MSDSPSSKPRHGRRANGGDAAKVTTGWGEETEKKPKFEQKEEVDVPTAEGGAADPNSGTTQNIDDDELAREVAAAPVDYHSAMPKLHDLDEDNQKWAALRNRSEDVDLTILTSVLCAQLDDEDTMWDPDLLLVQLTSELADQLEERTGADEGAEGQHVAPTLASVKTASPTVGGHKAAPSPTHAQPVGATDANVSAFGRKRQL